MDFLSDHRVILAQNPDLIYQRRNKLVVMVGAYERAKDFIERVHSGIITEDSSGEQTIPNFELAAGNNSLGFSGNAVAEN